MTPIEQIKEKIDIVELIAESGVNLRKSGRTFVGFCPFHPNSRTPAFTVYPDSQSYHCFGCKASGTAFDYVMRRQGVEFREALEQLAARAGVILEQRSEEEAALDQQRTRLFALNAAAARYFNYILTSHPRGTPGREYVEQRGIDAPTIEAFQLGYSLDEWDHLLRYLIDKKEFSLDEVIAAGLAISHESRGSYDRFRGRVIFPIRNGRGEIVGFGGRALGDGQPKYLNTPQTILFDKSNVLYGLDLARDGIRSSDAAVVMEGYIDVITAHQYGFRNAVAPLGTALTKQHVGMLKKLTNNLLLALDADAAGQKATLRGLSVIEEVSQEEDQTRHAVATAIGTIKLENELSLRIIRMPEGRDPDEVIRSDRALWEQLLAEAVPVMDFYIAIHTNGLDRRNARQQGEALDKLIPLLAELDGASQRAYIAKIEAAVGLRADLILDALRAFSVAKRRGARQGNASDEGATRTQGKREGNERGKRQGNEGKRSSTTPRPSQASPPSAPSADREGYLLGLVVRFPSVIKPIEQELASQLGAFPNLSGLFGNHMLDLFERTEYRAIYSLWLATPNEERPDSDELAAWIAQLPSGLREAANNLLNQIHSPTAFLFKPEAENCALYLRREQAQRWKVRLAERIDQAEDDDERQQAQQQFGELLQFLHSLRTPRRTSSFTDLRDMFGG